MLELCRSITFVVHLAVQWWGFSGYPGAEPGGRAVTLRSGIFRRARDERHGFALGALVQSCATMALAALAVDSDRPGGCDSLSWD